jgi:hypothetical protein
MINLVFGIKWEKTSRGHVKGEICIHGKDSNENPILVQSIFRIGKTVIANYKRESIPLLQEMQLCSSLLRYYQSAVDRKVIVAMPSLGKFGSNPAQIKNKLNESELIGFGLMPLSGCLKDFDCQDVSCLVLVLDH